MENPLLNQEKKPMKANPTEKPLNSSKVSISAVLFFIFICFSVVHFDLSPSELFHNTKFWFFLSNALILIIAADSGAFSSSKQKYDIYEDYLKNSRARINASSFVPVKTRPFSSSIETKHVIYEEPNENREQEDVIKGDLDNPSVKLQESEPPPERMTSEAVHKSENSENLEENTAVANIEEETHVEDPCETKEIRRSKSEEAISVSGKEKKRSLNRSVTEGHEPRYEENEFLSMSDEELNRRVENFIRNFNRQMRLQETRSLGWLEN